MNKHITTLLIFCAIASLAIAQSATVRPISDQQTGNELPSFVSIPAGAPSGTLNQVISFIGSQLANNRNIPNISETRIAVGSFVDISNLDETDKLGIIVEENLMHEMHVRGFGVVDFKMRDSLKVRQAGDFIFSRDIADLKRSYNIHYFLAGTISRNADGAVVNARLIQTDTSLVVSTAQGFISNKNLDRIFTERGRPVEKISVQKPSAPPISVR
jgi:TolB-like protein